jgi:hypothetical protein
MTPIPLHLPVRPDEASELAALIFEHAERKPLTGELRNRLNARAAVLRLESLTPYLGSLSRDPVHASTYYLAVDGEDAAPLLLHIALAGAPTSSTFHNALLIGRTRRMNGPEFVINALPFGPANREDIDRFTARIDPAFQPRPQGSRATLTIRSDYPRAFDFFRSAYKRTNRNLAAVAGDFHHCVWSAIRAGWRQDYTVVAEIAMDHTNEVVRDTLAYTRFTVDVTALPRGAAALKAAADEHEEIRQARALLKTGRDFDFEVELGDLAAKELASALEHLRQQGHAPQMVGVETAAVDEISEVARQYQITLSFRHGGESGAEIESRARATGGRWNYFAADPSEAETLAEYLLG